MKSVRKLLHLSQRQYGILIGVSQTAIALYEKGERKLPGEAFDKVLALQLQIEQLDLSPSVTPPPPTRKQQEQFLKVEELLDTQMRRAAAKALKLQRRLMKIKQQQQHFLQLQKLARQLKEQYVAGSLHRNLFDKMDRNATMALEFYGGPIQMILAYKIGMLLAREQIAKSLLSGNSLPLKDMSDSLEEYIQNDLNPVKLNQ
ncbi:helix-turn-helix domain-containing protein [Niabella sp. 22666]|uniref:helix-turn-helix domain-containing protein n=1 Tax=Niabella sp. 22666 TaxID=3453954 RepID=UPI003F84E950